MQFENNCLIVRCKLFQYFTQKYNHLPSEVLDEAT